MARIDGSLGLRCCIACLLGGYILAGAPVDARDRLDDDEGRARHLLERGELGEALEVATHRTAVAPHDARAWLLLGELQGVAGRPDEASASYQACIDNASHGAAVAACRERAR